MTVSLQKTLDRVVKFMRKQGKPSFDEKSVAGGACRFRHRGLKCAAGCLIPDAKYSSDLEKDSEVNARPVLGGRSPAEKILLACGHDLDLVSRLQSAHDNAASGTRDNDKAWLPKFETAAAKIATEFGLTYPV